MLSRPTGDAGVGLTDLLTSMLLMGVLLGMCATGAVTASRATTKAQARTAQTAELQQAVQRAAKHLRGVGPLLSAGPAGFTANEIRSGTRYFVAVDASTAGGRQELRYREWPCPAAPASCAVQPTGAASATETWLRDLRPPQAPEASGAWFRWSSQSGGVVSVASTPPGPMSDVFSVAVTLRLRTAGLPSQETGTVVALRNSTASTNP